MVCVLVRVCVYTCAGGRSFDRIMGVGFTLLGLFPDITDHIISIGVGQCLCSPDL